MTAADPLALTHSWPAYEAAHRLALGGAVPCDPELDEATITAARLDTLGLGLWYCDLRDNSLTWSRAVYDLFGLPADEPLARSLTVSLYLPRSRLAMEELRNHAIRHARGFTLDAQIRCANGDPRWMRLSALPIMVGRKVVRLCGTKRDVTAEYDGLG